MNKSLKFVRNLLIKVAKKELGSKGIIYYSELAEKAYLPFDNINDRNQLFKLIGEISSFEISEGRPMLSAVVINKSSRMPGKGFFKLAESENQKDYSEDNLIFWGRELKKVHEYWKNNLTKLNF